MMNTTLTAADLATFATLLVDTLGNRAGLANDAWWTARAAETYPIGSTPEAFAPYVLAAADKAGKLANPGPSLVCRETMPDGSAPIRLSFAIKCF